MPEPVEDWQSVDELDGIDIDRGEGCPHCGAPAEDLYVPNAGYYGCSECWAMWAGDRENAELVEEPVNGPAVEGGAEGATR